MSSLNPEAAVSSSSSLPSPSPQPPQPQPTDTLPAATAAVFAQFAAYDWDTDQRFQAGLKSILPPPPPPSESNATTPDAAVALEQAKFFYFSKFIHPIEKEPYLAWKASSSTTTSTLPDSSLSSSSSSTNEPNARTQVPPPSVPASGDAPTTTTQSTNLGGDANYPRSFQEICEMVARGDEVPGIRQIPDKLNDAPPSTSALGPRKKPWEKE
ncbi:hypothetical protein HDU88_003485 [Geranomyces variabilis]|nr:hypothetical protein HDU88_003485 [Geranomyces variabilis]